MSSYKTCFQDPLSRHMTLNLALPFPVLPCFAEINDGVSLLTCLRSADGISYEYDEVRVHISSFAHIVVQSDKICF